MLSLSITHSADCAFWKPPDHEILARMIDVDQQLDLLKEFSQGEGVLHG
jgi:hypothetical protein